MRSRRLFHPDGLNGGVSDSPRGEVFKGVNGVVPVIGLTGGIGAGKSTVARAFGELGCVVSDSDAQARVLLDSPAIVQQLVRWWGPGVMTASGGADRGAIASIVFADPGQRVMLEGLIHPLLKHDRDKLVAECRSAATPPPAVIIDAPLLLEAGLDAECDAVVFVDTACDQRLARVAATRGWDEGELRRREAAQLSLEEKRRRSGYILSNVGQFQVVTDQVAQILHQVRRSIRT